ncbi:ATP-binding protein, partial [Candidatus Poribacteria bacterium]|nr:ATP-binding protein [Candidatus Poribacteria bacterium]
TLKGIDRPTLAYRAVKVLPHPEKVRGIEGLRSPMIGRDEEFGKMKGCLDELIDGRGQMASIIGVAGVGKSRLVNELKQTSPPAPFPRREGGGGVRSKCNRMITERLASVSPVSYHKVRGSSSRKSDGTGGFLY